MALTGTYAGTFEGIPVYESRYFGYGLNSAGLALPGIGIFVGIGTFSKKLDIHTVMHEYGHFLQFQRTGWLKFYICIGLPSLLSAWFNWHKSGHQNYWTETWCNHLCKSYFSNIVWPEKRFPSRDINDKTKYWLVKRNLTFEPDDTLPNSPEIHSE